MGAVASKAQESIHLLLNTQQQLPSKPHSSSVCHQTPASSARLNVDLNVDLNVESSNTNTMSKTPVFYGKARCTPVPTRTEDELKYAWGPTLLSDDVVIDDLENDDNPFLPLNKHRGASDVAKRVAKHLKKYGVCVLENVLPQSTCDKAVKGFKEELVTASNGHVQLDNPRPKDAVTPTGYRKEAFASTPTSADVHITDEARWLQEVVFEALQILRKEPKKPFEPGNTCLVQLGGLLWRPESVGPFSEPTVDRHEAHPDSDVMYTEIDAGDAKKVDFLRYGHVLHGSAVSICRNGFVVTPRAVYRPGAENGEFVTKMDDGSRVAIVRDYAKTRNELRQLGRKDGEPGKEIFTSILLDMWTGATIIWNPCVMRGTMLPRKVDPKQVEQGHPGEPIGMVYGGIRTLANKTDAEKSKLVHGQAKALREGKQYFSDPDSVLFRGDVHVFHNPATPLVPDTWTSPKALDMLGVNRIPEGVEESKTAPVPAPVPVQVRRKRARKEQTNPTPVPLRRSGRITRRRTKVNYATFNATGKK